MKLKYQRQVDIQITYDEMPLDGGLRLDILVEGLIIFQLKAVDAINPVWDSTDT